MSDPVLCPISQPFLDLMRQPGGYVVLGPCRLYLQDDNVIVCQTLTIEEAVAFMAETGNTDAV